MTTFIYALIDIDTQELRYIGKANTPKHRLNRHKLEGREHTKSHRAAWMRSLHLQGKTPELLIIEEVDVADWQEAECFWIQYFISIGCRLVNSTTGGEGMENPTDEVRQKMSLGVSLALKGKPFSESHKQAISNALKGQIIPEAARLKMSEAAKNRSPNHVKSYIITWPDETEETIINLSAFIRDNPIFNHTGLFKVLSGKIDSYRGLKIRRVEETQDET